MTKKQAALVVLIAFFVGGIGGIFFGRFLIPYLGSIHGWEGLNKLVTTSPIVVNRTTEVQLNEGVNLIDLVKQAGNVTVSISDDKGNFLGNGTIISGDGLIFTTVSIAQKSPTLSVTTNDGQIFTATVKSKDAKTNLAILSVPAQGLATDQFEAAVNLQAAQRVIYIGRGNAKFQHEALAGLVTQSLANQLGGARQISTDAQLTADFIGGPILNLSGHLVGMVMENNQNIIAEDLQTALSAYLAK